jgi:hypothetical protein
MDIMVAQLENGTVWELRDLLGRSMGIVSRVGEGFIIAPAGGALETMHDVFLVRIYRWTPLSLRSKLRPVGFAGGSIDGRCRRLWASAYPVADPEFC